MSYEPNKVSAVRTERVVSEQLYYCSTSLQKRHKFCLSDCTSVPNVGCLLWTTGIICFHFMLSYGVTKAVKWGNVYQ